MAPDEESNPLKPGTLIDGKYEVRRLLGQGGMGSVVEATHLLRQARVALKFMSPHLLEIKGIVERFLNEGIAASRINSEHVVKVLDVSKLHNGQPYLVMEFLDGEDLESLLAREGTTGLAEVARAVHFVLQVLRGLQVAHSAGIIHRDLKPANCFVVAQDGEPDFIKLVDFGISKVQAGDGNVALTYEGSTMGTPLYVSLEQARNAANVDERSDLYSVAVMLYELLCGHTPFLPTNMADLLFHLAAGTPPPLDEQRSLPVDLCAVVHKGLARDREHRYQSAADFAAALAPFADDRSALVLRQMAQRGSVQPSRPPPYGSGAPGSQASRSGVGTPNPPRSAAAGASTDSNRLPTSASLGQSAAARSASPLSAAQVSVGHFASGQSGAGQQTPTGTLITHELTESVRTRAQAATQVAPNAVSVNRAPGTATSGEIPVKPSTTSSPVTRTGSLAADAVPNQRSSSRLWVPAVAAALTLGGATLYFTRSAEPTKPNSAAVSGPSSPVLSNAIEITSLGVASAAGVIANVPSVAASAAVTGAPQEAPAVTSSAAPELPKAASLKSATRPPKQHQPGTPSGAGRPSRQELKSIKIDD